MSGGRQPAEETSQRPDGRRSPGAADGSSNAPGHRSSSVRSLNDRTESAAVAAPPLAHLLQTMPDRIGRPWGAREVGLTAGAESGYGRATFARLLSFTESRMKRFLLLALPLGVALAGTLALRPAPLVGQPLPVICHPAACCAEKTCQEKGCCPTAGKAKDDAKVVAELVTILGETKNVDTFLATLLALGQFEDKSPLPAVIRNAERLGLLTGLSKGEAPSHAQQILGAYLSGEMTQECAPSGSPPCYPPAPAYCPTYAAPAPWCAPPCPPGSPSRPRPNCCRPRNAMTPPTRRKKSARCPSGWGTLRTNRRPSAQRPRLPAWVFCCQSGATKNPGRH